MDTPIFYIESARRTALDTGFATHFGALPQRYFSAPGRTEIGGNHTDHQRGRVLAGAVDLDTVAAVRANGTDTIRIHSKGFPACEVDLSTLAPVKEELGTTAALVRGVAAGFTQMGCEVGGFDAYCESTVLPGSGLSSSAAFEVLMGTIINCLFFEGRATPIQVAQIGQSAENAFFGKPCGLMDQMASAVGNLVSIDFYDPAHPAVKPVDFDFSDCGHALCIIDTGADHADLTEEYAAIPREMGQIAGHFGKAVLSQVAEEAFYAQQDLLRKKYGHRAVLRANHFFEENRRVTRQVAALERCDLDAFLELVRQSGLSSRDLLQNVTPQSHPERREMARALELCESLLQGKGASRVHGGGFAGTVQAFVPLEMLERFRSGIDAALGSGACHVLRICPRGGAELIPQEESL